MFKFLFLLLFIFFPLGQIERIPLANPQIGFYWHDIVISTIVSYWLVSKLVKKQKIILGKFGKFILLFYLALIVSFLVNLGGKTASEIIVALLYLIRWIFYAGLYFVIINEKINSLFNYSIASLLIFVGFAAALFGLIQYSFFPDIRSLTVFNWDPHYYRVVGTYLEPGYLSLILVLTIILGVSKIWPFEWKREKFFSYFILAVSYISFSLTYSRSAYLAYLVTIITISYLKKSTKFLLVTFLIFGLTILILPRPGGEGGKLERKYSIFSRLENWRQANLVIKKNPVMGVGFNFYRYTARDYGFLEKDNWQYSHAGAGVDNSFLFVLACSGVVGFLLYTKLIYEILKTSFQKINKNSIHLAVFVSVSVIICHSMFNNSLFYPWVMIWFWLIVGAMEYS